MLEEVKKVLAGIRKDTEKVIRRLTENHLRCERYDVTTAPNGTVIGVTQPFGTEELLIPYSWMCSNAQVGDTVIVVWWSGLSNAQAWFMGDGWVSHLLSITSGGGGITVNGTLSTTGNATIGGNLSVSGNENVNGNFTVLGNAMGRVLGLGQARAEIPENADLNDYVEPGVYGVGNNSIAGSLANRPIANAGTLRVWNALGDAKNPGDTWYYLLQEYVDYRGNVFMRYGESGSSTTVSWGAWFEFIQASGTVPIAKGGTGADNATDALNALLGHGSKNFTITAPVNSSYEVNFTYNELGIPAGGTMIMASLNQTHWSGDDVYHSVWQGFSWNDSDRLLKIRFWSTRSSQASVPFRLDYIYTK